MPENIPPSILIVDDDQGLTRLIERSLSRQGAVTSIALNGREALAFLEETQPDLMLLDLKLPDIEIKDLLDRLAGREKPVSFIVITGQGDERVAVEMMKRGALDYLVKDAQFLDLVPIVVQRTLEQLNKEMRLAAAEAALRREHAFSVAVLKAAGTLMVVADAHGKVLSINPACERLLGKSLRDVKGLSFGIACLTGAAAQSVSQYIDTIQPDARPLELESQLVAATGDARFIAWSITAQLSERGAVDYIIASGMDITERRRLEREILEVSDREQKRIGQDLHDGLCQVLAGIQMLAVVLKNDLSAKGRPEAVEAESIATYAGKAISQARIVSRGLSPVELETHGLMAALEEMAVNTEKLFHVRCHFICRNAVLIRDNAKATHLYRIAQEAISNAIKHGHAKNIRITLAEVHEPNTPPRASLCIADDGAGFSASGKWRSRSGSGHNGSGKGMGLRTMNHRAALIGASLSLGPNPPHGALVTCQFPLEA